MTRSEEHFRDAVAELRSTSVGDFAGGVSDERIAEAQVRLGVSFTPAYLLFLRSLGCGDVHGREIHGLLQVGPVDAGPIPNVVWYTIELRDAGLPKHCIAIADVGDGDIYVLDVNDREELVRVWSPVSLQIEQTEQ